MKEQKNISNATKYFKDHLSSGDYHSQGSKTAGEWIGKGCAELGLSGAVSQDHFMDLCNNIRPGSGGEQLTQRTNTVRENEETGKKEGNRRIFYDFVFAPPKSVSIAAGVAGDARVAEAHKEAMREVAAKMETYAATRLRGKKNILRGSKATTGNITAAAFHHDTSRAVADGVAPDSQIHSHLVVFNCTKHGEDWKALQNEDMMRASRYLNAIYEHKLCQSLKSLGYDIRTKSKGRWELAHIDDTTVRAFSKRDSAVKAEVDKRIAAGVKGTRAEIAKQVAHDMRIRKQAELDADALRPAWVAEINAMEHLTPEGKAAILAIPTAPVKKPENIVKLGALGSLEWSKRHLFERSAIVRDIDVKAEALSRCRGEDFSVEDLEKVFANDQEILEEVGQKVIFNCTTKEALECEQAILRIAADGHQKYSPYASALLPGSEQLNEFQRQAAEKVISSRSSITIFRGGAGTGKTFTLAHLAKGIMPTISAAGGSLIVLAPQNEQVLGLQADGFTGAKTLSSFLMKPPEISPGTVILVDEAGLIGGEDMLAFLRLAEKGGARVILSGDTRQHGAVARSNAMQLLEKHGCVEIAELSGEEAIQRQKIAWYKKAVALADQERAKDALKILDAHGAVVAVEADTRTSEAAKLWVAKREEGSVLLLSQTNAEVKALNFAVRDQLLAVGKLDQSAEVEFGSLRNLDCSNAEKEMSQSYTTESGEPAVIIFNREIGGLPGGAEMSFLREHEQGDGIIALNPCDGQEFHIPRADIAKISIYEREPLKLAPGELIQLKANIKLDEGKTKLANGQIMEFVGLSEKGGLIVRKGKKEYTLPPTFKQIRYGYAVTSIAAQGKTVDHVIVSDSACKGASSAHEFYVSISRGKMGVSILTTDKEQLEEHISKLEGLNLAVDLKIGEKRKITQAVAVVDMGAGRIAAIAERITPKAYELPSAMVAPGENPKVALKAGAEKQGWKLDGELSLAHRDKDIAYYSAEKATPLTQYEEKSRLMQKMPEATAMPTEKHEAIAACLARSMEVRLQDTPAALPRLGWWARCEQFISKTGEIFMRGLQERIPEAVKEFFHSREKRREASAEMER